MLGSLSLLSATVCLYQASVFDVLWLLEVLQIGLLHARMHLFVHL